MSVLALPLMLLNLLAGIVGGVWLLLLGKWQLVALGLASTIGGTFIISLLLLPGTLIMLPFMRDAPDAQPRSALFVVAAGLIGLGYTYCVMGAWAIMAFKVMTSDAGSAAKIPALLWSYAASTAIWNHMAQRELQAGNEYTPISAFFHQIGCVALLVYGFAMFPRLHLGDMTVWYSLPMVLSLILQLRLAVQMSKLERYARY